MIEAVFVPVVTYDFTMGLVDPERLSVPVHEYVYAPVPPDGTAVQVTFCPVTTDVGEAEQVVVRAGVTVIGVVGCAVAVPRVMRTRAVEFAVYAGHVYEALVAAIVCVFSYVVLFVQSNSYVILPVADPPVTVAVSVDVRGEMPLAGVAVSVAVTVWALTLTLLAQLTGPTDCVPDVTVIEAVFVPVVTYDFTMGLVDPERLSVPVHEYVYAPVPPDGTAVQVTFCPVTTDVGEAEQVVVRAVGSIVTL